MDFSKRIWYNGIAEVIALEIRLSRDAEKFLRRVDSKTRQRLIAGIAGLTQKPPKGDIKPLSGYTDGRFRLRVGGYRVIYKIFNDAIENFKL